jgi:hypothetical protein
LIRKKGPAVCGALWNVFVLFYMHMIFTTGAPQEEPS